jgi:hypothetical protein
MAGSVDPNVPRMAKEGPMTIYDIILLFSIVVSRAHA